MRIIKFTPTLRKLCAGYKVVLLVLGTAGEGVKRAHEFGLAVVGSSPEVDVHRMLIE